MEPRSRETDQDVAIARLDAWREGHDAAHRALNGRMDRQEAKLDKLLWGMFSAVAGVAVSLGLLVVQVLTR